MPGARVQGEWTGGLLSEPSGALTRATRAGIVNNMKRGSPHHVAFGSAFGSSIGATRIPSTAAGVRGSISRPAIAFVAGFPGVIGALALVAAFSRSGTRDGAFALGVALLGVAAVLLVLGLASTVSIASDEFTVRFFGIRRTTVRLSEIESATFRMAFPSISYALVLTGVGGRKALFHANWWRNEGPILGAIGRALLDRDVSMDRSTARIVSRALGVRRPKARILHHGLVRHERTW